MSAEMIPTEPFWRLEAMDADGRVVETAHTPQTDAVRELAGRMVSGTSPAVRVMGYYVTEIMTVRRAPQCDTISCKAAPTHVLSWRGHDGETVREKVCDPCGQMYLRRPALKDVALRLMEGGTH
ncbi:hypothetical protein ACZ90_00380 [Streptomyces albus subsp. albus]|nr:hypothetical protein ACZ90_00380 [Streptomyces albus subsp. albus]